MARLSFKILFAHITKHAPKIPRFGKDVGNESSASTLGESDADSASLGNMRVDGMCAPSVQKFASAR